MRTWMLAAACSWISGCVVVREDPNNWSSNSTFTSTSSPRGGELQVSWRVGSSGCEGSGVETVEVDLDGAVATFVCADGEALLTAAVGKHPLTLRGLDADGVARYEGSGGKVQIERGQVTTAATVILSARPASIDAAWYFENGRLCSANGVARVEVDLFDNNDVLQFSEEVPCDEGSLRLVDVEPGAYVVLALGRDADGLVTWGSERELDADPGDMLGVEMMLVSEL